MHGFRNRTIRSRYAGFTLIELLTVIAIIAILAALLFPVFSTVREQTRRTKTMTQMHDVYIALKQYHEDNNRYPASLLGFVQYLDNAQTPPYMDFYTGTGTPVTIEQLSYRPLNKGQKYMINDKTAFISTVSTSKDPTVVTAAVYPPTVGPLLANQQVLFNSTMANSIFKDPVVTNDYPPNSELNKTKPFVTVPPILGTPAYYYNYDSFDTGPQVAADGTIVPGVRELHYSLDWTGVVSRKDYKQFTNQMKYGAKAPDDRTVVTWCTDHVAYANSDKILVLLLNGTTKAADAKTFVAAGPLGYIP